MAKAKPGFTIFKALGDETRYNLACALLGGERCACELPAIVRRAQPTVSLQLKYLLKSGIVSSRRDGKKILYKLKSQEAARIMAMLGIKKIKVKAKC